MEQMNMCTIGAYRITHVLSGVFYIGSSGNIDSRYRQHRSELKRGNHPSSLLKIVYRYGDILELEIFPTIDRDSAYRKEQEILNYHYHDLKCATQPSQEEYVVHVSKNGNIAMLRNREVTEHRYNISFTLFLIV